jgi:hypothetical protein
MATKTGRARLVQVTGVTIAHALNPHADTWARDLHLKYLAVCVVHPQEAVPGPERTQAGIAQEVWTNLANALALQPTERTFSPLSSREERL